MTSVMPAYKALSVYFSLSLLQRSLKWYGP